MATIGDDDIEEIHQKIHDAVQEKLLELATLLVSPEGADNYGQSNTFVIESENGKQEYRYAFRVEPVELGEVEVG